ncbi:MAG: hypothetical protein ACO3UM_06015, partial [Planctomycetota bacterium]
MEPRPDDADTSARTIALAALGHAGGPLRVGGVLATDLLEQFGSPLYAYDAAVLETQIAAVQSAFDGQVQGVKVLGRQDVLRLVNNHGVERRRLQLHQGFAVEPREVLA